MATTQETLADIMAVLVSMERDNLVATEKDDIQSFSTALNIVYNANSQSFSPSGNTRHDFTEKLRGFETLNSSKRAAAHFLKCIFEEVTAAPNIYDNMSVEDWRNVGNGWHKVTLAMKAAYDAPRLKLGTSAAASTKAEHKCEFFDCSAIFKTAAKKLQHTDLVHGESEGQTCVCGKVFFFNFAYDNHVEKCDEM